MRRHRDRNPFLIGAMRLGLRPLLRQNRLRRRVGLRESPDCADNGRGAFFVVVESARVGFGGENGGLVWFDSGPAETVGGGVVSWGGGTDGECDARGV